MKVTIYTIPNCPFCQQAKDFMTSKFVSFVEKDVLSDKDSLAEMLSASNKFAGVPCAVVETDGGEKVVLKGFDSSEYEKALGVAGGVPVPSEPALPVEPVTNVTPDAVPAAPSLDSSVSTPPVSMPGIPTEVAPLSGVTTPPSPMVSTDSGMPSVPRPDVPGSQMGMPASLSSGQPGLTEPTQSQVGSPVSDVMPTQGVGTPAPAPSTTASPEPADPQDELSGLLKDLESKVAGVTPTPVAAPSSAPSVPSSMPTSGFGTSSDGSSSVGAPAPMNPGMAGVSAPGPVTSADLPDFNQAK